MGVDGVDYWGGGVGERGDGVGVCRVGDLDLGGSLVMMMVLVEVPLGVILRGEAVITCTCSFGLGVKVVSCGEWNAGSAGA